MENIDLNKLILKGFESLHKSPRDNQVEVITQILLDFYEKGKKYIVLNAPTGSGKSIIAAVVAYCIEFISDELDTLNRVSIDSKGNKIIEEGPYSWILSSQNILLDQYIQTITPMNPDFEKYIGANNFPCLVSEENETAEECARYMMISRKNNLRDSLDEKDMAEVKALELKLETCDRCPFHIMKVRFQRNQMKHIITNNAMFLTVQGIVSGAKKPECLIFDESHLFPDNAVSSYSFEISKESLKKTYEENSLVPIDQSAHRAFKALKDELEEIDETSYKDFLREILNYYNLLIEYYKDKAEQVYAATGDNKTANEIRKMGRKYEGPCSIMNKILRSKPDFFLFDTPKIDAFGKPTGLSQDKFSIVPIFADFMIEDIDRFSNKFLLMSATNHPGYISKTFGIPKDQIHFINIPSVFPIENKPVYFMNSGSINMGTLKSPTAISQIVDGMHSILNSQVSMNGEVKGIILTSSYDWTSTICSELRKRGDSAYLVEHTRGTKVKEILEAFKNKKGFAVLVSPTIFEGVSLDDDLCRFQILLKAPYPSLGDKRINFISKHHQEIYEILTIMKIVQGLGRGVRSKEDFADSFLVDSQLTRLFKSNANVWRNQFEEID